MKKNIIIKPCINNRGLKEEEEEERKERPLGRRCGWSRELISSGGGAKRLSHSDAAPFAISEPSLLRFPFLFPFLFLSYNHKEAALLILSSEMERGVFDPVTWRD